MNIWTIVGAASTGEPGQGGMFSFTGTMILMMGLFYFMLIRPQRRKEKDRREMLSKIKSGDRVMFGGGILGTVTNVKEKTALIRIAEKVKVEVSRGAVTHILEKGEIPEDDPAA